MVKTSIYFLLVAFLTFSLAEENIKNLASIGDKQTVSRTSRLSNFSHLIDNLQWKNIAILQTRESDISLQIPGGVSFLLYTINHLNTRETLNQIHSKLFPDVNIILTANVGFLKDFILKVDNFDEENNHTTDFRHHSKWLITCKDPSFLHVDQHIHFLENVAVILTPKETSNTDCSQRHLTIRRHPHGSVFAPVTECGADISLCYFPNVKYGYNNRHLRVMMLPSLVHVRKKVVNGTANYTSYAPQILQLIAQKLNFSYSILEPPDRSWGLLRNGTWDGIVGHLHRKEIDLAACDITIHEERAKVVDFIYPPIKTERTTIVYKTHQQSYLFLLTRPLHWEVYLVIFAVTLIVLIIFKCAENQAIIGRETKQENVLGWTCRKYVAGNGNHIARAFLRQGSVQSPETGSGRLLLSSWWLFLIIMTSVYCANLVASFSAQRDIRPFSNIQELLESDYDVGMRTTGITHLLIKTSKTPLLKQLWGRINQLTNESLNLPGSAHLRKVKSVKYAFLTYQHVAEIAMADDCDFDILDDFLSLEHLAFSVPKQSPLKTDIDKIMSILKESGILDIIWRKLSKTRNSTMCVSERQVKSISLTDLAGVGVLVCAGVLLASIGLVCERFKQGVK